MSKGPLVTVMPRAILCVGTLLLASGETVAEEPQEGVVKVTEDSAELSKIELKAVDSATLGAQRARQGVNFTQLSNIEAQIDLHGNSVEGAVSGDNILGEGVFSGAQGIATIIQNSGHNVAIQESLIINIAISP